MSSEHREPESAADPRPARFMELYTQFHRQLYVYIATLVPTPADAQDLLQETSLTLWQKFDEFEPGTSFLAWARTVARFRVLQFHEKSGRAVSILPPEVLNLLAASPSANSSEQMEELHFQALMECMERLRPSDRDLLNVRYHRKVSVKDLAAQEGRSANAISQSLARIRGTLFDCIRLRLKRNSGETPHA